MNLKAPNFNPIYLMGGGNLLERGTPISLCELLRNFRLVATNENFFINTLFQSLRIMISVHLNCDETGMPLDDTPACVVGIKGKKHHRAVTSGNIIVLACVNAAGNVIPPLVIFSRKAFNMHLTIAVG